MPVPPEDKLDQARPCRFQRRRRTVRVRHFRSPVDHSGSRRRTLRGRLGTDEVRCLRAARDCPECLSWGPGGVSPMCPSKALDNTRPVKDRAAVARAASRPNRDVTESQSRPVPDCVSLLPIGAGHWSVIAHQCVPEWKGPVGAGMNRRRPRPHSLRRFQKVTLSSPGP